VFGVHAVGGITGALLTGVFNSQSLGGPGFVTDWVTGRVAAGAILPVLLVGDVFAVAWFRRDADWGRERK